MQLVRVMDKMWLKHGLDLKIITFRCQATGPKRGKYTVACQGGGVPSKTRRHGANKTLALNPLVC